MVFVVCFLCAFFLAFFSPENGLLGCVIIKAGAIPFALNVTLLDKKMV